ncbi:protein RKD1 [Brachypodium distachyon]|uniref:RWP-RK domain-containing protein n=1 Tax=Brachypodium distachyon TaxID=15368 RepID=A0A2K2D5V5_BRADI|nr:protein RKD1 [Brachypodium distachyon]PNT69647.1 hypothetical protein BRADI_3g59420v3 [Brachypodium distachyon]PNT69648.1 hypothetical protein BRADI_3g59420v3 [Brachypodium distachyon]|eukprot:XP_014756080.1 protein RKD1 [Brachypodium distachyon]
MEKATKNEEHLSDGSQREKPSLRLEQVSQYFCMPLKQAAEELKVGQTTLKRSCRELRILRWPHRKVKSLQTLIENVQELEKDDVLGRSEKIRAVVQILQQRQKLMEERPAGVVELDKETRIFMQACYKEMYNRRRKGVKFAWMRSDRAGFR